MPSTRNMTQVIDVLAVVKPGETITYTELLDRLKREGRPRAACGVLLRRFEFAKSGAVANGLLCSWREPYFDDENFGAWAEGTLHISRRPEGDPDGSNED